MTHLILYDGSCGLCSRAVRFVLRRDAAGRFRFASLQGRFATELLAQHGAKTDLETMYVVTGDPPQLLDRSRAVRFIAGELGLPWSLFGSAAGLLPATVLDRLYTIVARNRHRLFRDTACTLPSPAERDRFLDDGGAAFREPD